MRPSIGLVHAHANERRQILEQVQRTTGNALLARALDARPQPAPSAARGLTISRAPATPKRQSNPSAKGRIRPLGIKSFLVKKAVKLLATTIRHGGDLVKEIVKHVDEKAARAFDKHADEIADELDDIARIPDLTTRIVKQKVYWFCRNELKLSGGTSQQIADGIERALDIIVF